MNVINVDKKVEHQTDQIEMVVSLICFLNKIRLSKTEQKALAFYVVYGLKEETDQLLINSKIVPHLESLRNVKSRLCKTGFFRKYTGVYKSYELALDKNFDLNANVIEVVVKIDRS